MWKFILALLLLITSVSAQDLDAPPIDRIGIVADRGLWKGLSHITQGYYWIDIRFDEDKLDPQKMRFIVSKRQYENLLVGDHVLVFYDENNRIVGMTKKE